MTHSKPARALLMGIDYAPGSSIDRNIFSDLGAKDSVDELEELALTAGATTIKKVIQSRKTPHHKWYLGMGKIDEIKEMISDNKIDLVIADDELTATQTKGLEKALNVKVMDRTGLILDIFAQRAQTFEAQLQVELAQLDYLLPRLTRMWTHLSRLGGGIGTRGPGEKQLEVDKRKIRDRIALLKRKLAKVKRNRDIQRTKRRSVPVITGALVGYSNAGKSTLLNALTQTDVFVEDKLFATLDPTTRKLFLPKHKSILLTDTVGFVQKLPHQLVEAFHATLEEVTLADFILHIVDVSDPHFKEKIHTADTLLAELGADEIPQLFVFNKVDKLKDKSALTETLSDFAPYVLISAEKKWHLDTLKTDIDTLLTSFEKRLTFKIPYDRMDIVALLHKLGHVIDEDYDTTITITVSINQIVGEKIMGQLARH